MTTYCSGHEPESSPASWYGSDEPPYVIVCVHDLRIKVEDIEADRVCRAFHVEALARDYAKARASMDDAATSADMESVRAAYYDAALALCEALR